MAVMTRRPAVAGSFYPADPEALRSAIDAMTGGRTPPREPIALALLVPHAGYVYSGRVASETYLASRLPARLVILGPNHTGEGSPIAIMSEGSWRTPLGDAGIDAALATAILGRCPAASEDAAAHRREHSIEVQVPILQRLVPDFRFVPVCVGTQRLTALLDLGRSLAAAIQASGGECLMVMSSDMSHYVPAALAERQDRKALDRIRALDPAGLHRVVLEEEISMCGMAPAVAGLEAARLLGASSARMVAYGHSGERTGDDGSVVAYAGVSIL
jgi:AmmeMemoRadiSam system protein B